MIMEIAKFDVRPDDVPAFIAAAQIGARIFAAADGCLGMELRQCIEEPGSFRMIVMWRRIEDHIVTFRASKGVQEWRGAIGKFLTQPADIQNFEEPVVQMGHAKLLTS
jgi:quinol monooxygenase YgiN